MTNPKIARAIMRASLALPNNHPVQAALDAAHDALFQPIATAHQGVDHSQDAVASVLGRELSR